MLKQLFEVAGIGRDRIELRWVSAAEGQMFADFVKELTQRTRELGPFDPASFELQLAAVNGALDSPRLRWLVGIDRQLTQRENVYHERISEEEFQKMLRSAVEMEYQQALIIHAMKKHPMTVREIAKKTGLSIHTVSLRLGNLEKSGKVDLHSYEGTTPRFVGIAA